MCDYIKGVYTSAIVFLILCTLLMAYDSKEEHDKWQDACDELDIEIRWHEMSLDGVKTNWVELIDVRTNEIRKSR